MENGKWKMEIRDRAFKLIYFLFSIFLFLFSAFCFRAGAQQSWKILALRVEFLPDESPTTTGDGTFDLRGFDEARGSYEFPYDTPPHNRQYFEWHLEALANYYRRVSEGKVEITFDVFPKGLDESYRLGRTMISYGIGRTKEEIDRKLVEFFRDSIALADSIEGDDLDFSSYQSFLVLHAGVGRETGTLNDIPSAYLSPSDLEIHLGGSIPVDGGAHQVRDGLILPEAISQNGAGGLNGTVAKFFGYQLGLPGLSNFADGLPAVGGWSLMDTGSQNFGAGMVGYVPSHPMAWSKIKLGWISPVGVIRDTMVLIAATDISTDLPQAVKIPISSDEYFLLENRQARRRKDEIPEVQFSIGDSAGVWLSVDRYDSYIPGSGILIWHVDESVIEQRRLSGGINDDPLRRGIDLEEADGYEDIGNITNFERLDHIEGSEDDPFFYGGKTEFSPPNSNTNLGTESGVRIVVLSPPQDTMAVEISFDRNEVGWPLSVPSSFGGNAPKWADLDGDGRKELVAISLEGKVYVWRADGVPFHPGGAFASLEDSVLLSPALGDLDGHSGPEIVIAEKEGSVSAWLTVASDEGGRGELLWRAEMGSRTSAPPVIADVDPADGVEVILGTEDGKVLVFSGKSGETLWTKEEADGSAITGIAVGDERNEIVGSTKSGVVFLVEGPEGGRPISDLKGEIVGPPVIADLDGEGKTEIVAVSSDGRLAVFSPWERFEVELQDRIGSSPVLSDIDGDGFLEIVVCGTGKVHAWRFNGIPQAGFPVTLPLKDNVGLISSAPVIADIDDDGDSEIIFGSSVGHIYAVDGSGDRVRGFPLSSIGPITSSLMIDDIDEDGRLEVAALTAKGWAHLWDLERVDASFRGKKVLWGMSGGNAANTSAYPDSLLAPFHPTSEQLLPWAYCYPNPISKDSDQYPYIHLRFFLAQRAGVKVKIFNSVGELVEELSKSDGVAQTDNEVLWDTTDYESGLYICRLEAIGKGSREVVFIKAAVSK